MDTAEHLAWEAQQRPRAAAAAAASAVLTAIGGIVQTLALRDAPSVSILRSIERADDPGKLGSQPSFKGPQFEYLHDQLGQLLIGSILIGLGAILAGYALTFLARATKARTEAMPRIAVRIPIVGGILYALGSVLFVVGRDAYAQDLVAMAHTIQEIKDLSTPTLLIMGSLVLQVGLLVFAIGYVLVSLNAMRVGLLTRFMGILGIIVGVSLILPFLQGLVLLNTFWLFALGALFLNRWPNGIPPAWESGKAEPWPSTAQLRAEAAAARGNGPAESPAAEEPDGDDGDGARAPHPSSKKKKRKRRG